MLALVQKPDCNIAQLGAYAGAFDSLACPGFEGDTAGGCQHCKRPAVLHELLLGVAENGQACLLGRTARLLLKARIALTQHRSIAW